MSIWAFVFLLTAAIIFGLEAWLHKALIALGLCLISLGLIWQFASTSHTFNFG